MEHTVVSEAQSGFAEPSSKSADASTQSTVDAMVAAAPSFSLQNRELRDETRSA